MDHVRQTWMFRAAAGAIVIGAILIVWTVLWVWLYREAAAVAPDWMVDRQGGRSSFLDRGSVYAYGVTTALIAACSAVVVFKLLRVPSEVFEPGGGAGDYPFHNRQRPPKARAPARKRN